MYGIEPYEDNEGNMILWIKHHRFVFDKKGFKMFVEEFDTDSFEIIVVDRGDPYLARQNKFNPEWNPQFFHRWMKFKRTCRKNVPQEILVHHRNTKTTDNRIKNLIFQDGDKHYAIHRKKRAYKTFCETFRVNNPDASPQKVNYFWRKFKEKHSIS